MWHVDEGTLHAYLDGALEEYPNAEARRVREHLDGCPVCRERLKAERRIRDDAAAILGLASPHVEAPTFEELRAYVRANPRGRGPASTRLYRLGWAASLVLALGAGWMLRGGDAVPALAPAAVQDPLAPPPERSVPEVTPAAGAPARAGAGADEPAAPADPGSLRTARDPSDRQMVAEATEPSDATVAPMPEAQPVQPGAEPREAIADLPVAPAPPSVTVVVPEVVPAASRQDSLVPSARVVEREDVVEETRPERRAPPVEVVTSAQVSAPTAGLVLGRTGGDGDARDEITTDEDSYSLVVPGLRVLDVRFRGTGTRPEGQVALQLLESGDTLRVIHLPAELSPDSVEAGPAGDNELVMQRSAGWIIMRAPLSEAELMELMTRLLSGG